jgi:xylulokinase
MSELLVGVDLGTTGTKAALYSAGGETLAETTADTPLRWHGPGRVDQDPDDFYAAATRAIRECLERADAAPDRVEAVGVTGQMAGVLGIDADWRPSTPYDSWLDLRCTPDVEALDRELGARLIELSGCPAMVNHGPKMRWWRRERPDAFAATAKFVVPSGYVAGRLAGLAAGDAFVDRSYLHFSGVADTRAGRWSEELAAAVGVPAEKLPRIVEPVSAVGAVCTEAAEQSGLREGTPVAAGLGDTAASVLGAGVVAPGQLLDVAGTAAVLSASGTEFVPDVEHRTLIVMRGALEGQWISLAYLSAGSLLEWVGETLWDRGEEPAPGFDELARVAREAPSGSAGLVFIPHVDGRLLPSRPQMRGAWAGLTRHHGRSHMVRSVLEGVAYEYAHYLRILRELHPELDLREVRVVGGGARSDTWNAIKASALGVPYVSLARGEFSCWGAALVAGKAVGLADDLAATAMAATEVERRFEPDDREHEVYARLAQVYSGLLEALDPAAEALAEAAAREEGGE